MIKSYIKRDKYIKKIIPFINKNIIKVIVGQRRVGKSYFLYQIIDEIKKSDQNANIIYINKELYDFDEIVDHRSLFRYVNEKTIHGKNNYLFIDEIQDIAFFEKALRHLATLKEFDIYCTGSNAKLLSQEIATNLSGRYIEILMQSLSYPEFIFFHGIRNDNDSLFKYIKYGGLPYLIHLELEDEIVYDYLRNIYNTIILKDVVSRYNIRNVNFLDRLVEFLANSIGNILSAKKISDFLKSQKTDISPNTILNYLNFLCSSFFISKASRFDIIGKRIFEVGEKYFFQDLGLRNMLVGYKQIDIAKILENLVYSHLIYLGFDVKIAQIGKKEIDFVAEYKNNILYLQVTYLLKDDKARKREFGNLLDIKDNYPKYVISMDEMAGGNIEGIKHIHILEFLNKQNISDFLNN